jgi:hypothetical protein
MICSIGSPKRREKSMFFLSLYGEFTLAQFAVRFNTKIPAPATVAFGGFAYLGTLGY